MKVSRAALLAFAVFLMSAVPAFAGPGWASDTDEKPAIADQVGSLEGVQGVYVLGSVDKDLIAKGLSEDAVTEAMKQKLKAAGIKVLTKQELTESSGFPVLGVNMISSEKDGVQTIFITLELAQVVLIVRGSPTMVFGVTWHKGGVWRIDNEKVPTLKTAVNDLVDEFAQDYFTANPK